MAKIFPGVNNWEYFIKGWGHFINGWFFGDIEYFKDTLSGWRQFLATESPLKMMKNAFYFTLKALFVLKIFIFLP